jgi:hypothetical protein
MKKLIFYIVLFCSLSLGLVSCEDETSEDTSYITYYVEIELEGDDPYLVEMGTDYVDPGYTAYEGDEDVTESVVVTGIDDIDTDAKGVYTVTYTCQNSDGYEASTERTVVVYDSSITTGLGEGTYTVTSDTYRNYNGTLTSYSGYDIDIDSIAPGIYYCSDFLGGYYDQYNGYGSSYAMTGYFSLESDNTLELCSSYVSGWGDGLEYMEGGSYDPDSGQIYWMVDYAGYIDFYVYLLK